MITEKTQSINESPVSTLVERDIEAATQEPTEPVDFEGLAEQDANPAIRPDLVSKESYLTRVITGRSAASSWIDPGPPPDGGRLAWTQAVMGHLVIFTTWGYVSSYGTFQSYYVETLGHSPSDIS